MDFSWIGQAASDFRTDVKDYIGYQLNKGVSASQKWQSENDVLYWNRNRHAALDDWARNRDFTVQREDTELRRRVADAKAAGLHPVFAMGASVNSAIPGTPGQTVPRGGGTPDNVRLSGGGQQVSKVLGAAAIRRAHLENKDLENKIKRDEADFAQQLAQSSGEMRFRQELQNRPQLAHTYSATAHEASRRSAAVAKLTQAFEDELGVRTTRQHRIKLPGGDEIIIPKGITPVEIAEMVMGESSDLIGLSTGIRGWLKGQGEKHGIGKPSSRPPSQKRKFGRPVR